MQDEKEEYFPSPRQKKNPSHCKKSKSLLNVKNINDQYDSMPLKGTKIYFLHLKFSKV